MTDDNTGRQAGLGRLVCSEQAALSTGVGGRSPAKAFKPTLFQISFKGGFAHSEPRRPHIGLSS